MESIYSSYQPLHWRECSLGATYDYLQMLIWAALIRNSYETKLFILELYEVSAKDKIIYESSRKYWKACCTIWKQPCKKLQGAPELSQLAVRVFIYCWQCTKHCERNTPSWCLFEDYVPVFVPVYCFIETTWCKGVIQVSLCVNQFEYALS